MNVTNYYVIAPESEIVSLLYFDDFDVTNNVHAVGVYYSTIK